MDKVSIIIPAYNEGYGIGQTLSALTGSGDWFSEIIVVDDGSADDTYDIALEWTKNVIRFPYNRGKAAGLIMGSKAAHYPILLFLDADLEGSARLARHLVEPIWNHKADMTIAKLPPTLGNGFGLVKRFAAMGIYSKTKRRIEAPLSGQRAIRKDLFEQCYLGDHGFGVEVGLTLDVLLSGYTVQEVGIDFNHREKGKTIHGFTHRMRQGFSVCRALLARR